MRLTEFHAWFQGFCDGVGNEGLNKQQWYRLAEVLDMLENDEPNPKHDGREQAEYIDRLRDANEKVKNSSTAEQLMEQIRKSTPDWIKPFDANRDS